MKENLSATKNITGEILSNLRKDKRMTQKEFADIFSVSESTIAHYEQGITIPNADMLCKFADYFNVTVDYLLGRCSCTIDYKKLNLEISKGLTIGEIADIISKLPKDKRNYLCQTIKLLIKP